MPCLLDLAEPIEPVLATAPGAAVYQRFQNEPDVLAIAVVDADNRPVGIVERHSFFLSLAAEYGRPLYAQRPISLLMNSEPLVVDGGVGLVAFTGETLAERPSELLSGFIVVSDERYVGMGSALGLLQASNRANKAHAVEMTRLAESLQAAQAQAQAALKAKSRFLAVMSHEIRTPLNGVLAVAEIIARQIKQDDLRPLVQIVVNSGENLLTLLTDALDISRADAGQLDLKLMPFAVDAMLDGVESLWSAQAAEKGVAFEVIYDGPAKLRALGDVVRLKQVLDNLIGNALKYTDTGSVTVRLRARPDGIFVRLHAEICDTGPGLPEAQLQSVFQPFSQYEDGWAKGGAGLGLSICRELVQLMNGDIRAECRPEGGLKVAFDATLFHEFGEQAPLAMALSAAKGLSAAEPVAAMERRARR
jgi:signal transduction histidine kinase